MVCVKIMSKNLQNAIVTELLQQVKARKVLAYERRSEYCGSDPIKSLPLSDYLKGIIDGRLETWEFFERLINEVIVTETEKAVEGN